MEWKPPAPVSKQQASLDLLHNFSPTGWLISKT